MASQSTRDEFTVHAGREASHDKVGSPSILTPAAKLVPNGFIAHPEVLQSLQSRPGQISYSVLAGKYAVIFDQEATPEGLLLTTGQPWLSEDPNRLSEEPLKMHIDCTFLTPNALRVRMGFDSLFPFPDPYPDDPDFPPPTLRQHLFPPVALIEPNVENSRNDLVCGLELRSDDGEIWVNPRGSGFELKHASAPFGLSATWGLTPPSEPAIETATSDTSHSYDDDDRHESQIDETNVSRPLEKPIFEQAPLGPFTQALLPNGIMNTGSKLVSTELLILDNGEKLQSGGPGRHRGQSEQQPPLQLKTTAALSDSRERDGNEIAKTESSTSSENLLAGKLESLPKESREMHLSHFSGRWTDDTSKLLPPPFLHADRGWGILMKAPVGANMTPLLDGRAMLGLTMEAGENGVLEYIIVAGEALRACKEEYPVEPVE